VVGYTFPVIRPSRSSPFSASVKVPERILFLKYLPKGITGKVQRRALKEMSSTAAPTLIIDPTAAAIL